MRGRVGQVLGANAVQNRQWVKNCPVVMQVFLSQLKDDCVVWWRGGRGSAPSAISSDPLAAFVRDWRSEPARSQIISEPVCVVVLPSSEVASVTLSVSTRCDRLLLAFMFVALRVRRCDARCSSAMVSSGELTVSLVRPATSFTAAAPLPRPAK